MGWYSHPALHVKLVLMLPGKQETVWNFTLKFNIFTFMKNKLCNFLPISLKNSETTLKNWLIVLIKMKKKSDQHQNVCLPICARAIMLNKCLLIFHSLPWVFNFFSRQANLTLKKIKFNANLIFKFSNLVYTLLEKCCKSD